jgi:hypothetical protein
LPSDLQATNEIEFREEQGQRTVSQEVADELRYAPLANLKGHAVSEQATALVGYLAHKYPRVTQTARKTKRTNKPRKLEQSFHRAIAAFVAELLAARAQEEAAGWLRLSLDKRNFIQLPRPPAIASSLIPRYRGPCGLQINDQLELGRLQHRQIGRLLTLSVTFVGAPEQSTQ